MKWTTGHTVIAYQLIVLLSLPFYFIWGQRPCSALIITSCLFYAATMLAITAGYHRLYSHRTYKVHPIIEYFILFFGSMAAQYSVLRWSFEHRHHHAYVDTDNDPYSINKGFWYAHLLWLFDDPEEIDEKVVKDLLANPLVRFQHKYEIPLMLMANIVPTLILGWLIHDMVGAFVLAFGVRLLLCHHCTYCINSLAHTIGAKPYSEKQSAVNNWFAALVTFGEGYHNFHHVFPRDYRNGIRWYQFDPTKWFIWLLSKCRLAKDLKKVDEKQIQAAMHKTKGVDVGTHPTETY